MVLMLRGAMTCNAEDYMTAADYWQRYEPGAYEIFLSLPDPEAALAKDTARAAEIAQRLGEPSRHYDGENLLAFRRCVWEVVYS
jgi:4-hydroxyphenylpyruvate dioxygenase-like putative hemolysin